jgi:excisionase family DNA binding protein
MSTNQNETRVRLLTIRQAANVIDGLTEHRIRQLCRAGELPCVMAGKKYLINEQTLIGAISAMDKRDRRAME